MKIEPSTIRKMSDDELWKFYVNLKRTRATFRRYPRLSWFGRKAEPILSADIARIQDEWQRRETLKIGLRDAA